MLSPWVKSIERRILCGTKDPKIIHEAFAAGPHHANYDNIQFSSQYVTLYSIFGLSRNLNLASIKEKRLSLTCLDWKEAYVQSSP